MASIAAIEDLGDTCRFALDNEVVLLVGCSYPVLERHLHRVGTSPVGRQAAYSVNELTPHELRLCCRLIADRLPASHAAFAEHLRQTTRELLAEPHRLVKAIDTRRPLFQLSHPYHFRKTGRLFSNLLSWRGQLLQTRVDLTRRTVAMQALKQSDLFLEG